MSTPLRHDASSFAARSVWPMVAAIPLVLVLTHYVAVLPHEFSHSITAWLVGIKPVPGDIDWGGTGLWNIVALAHIDENVDYDAALAAGKYWQVALVAFAGPGIGNAVPYLVTRWLFARGWMAARPWVSFILFWYMFLCLANLWDYVPLRTFADDGDVTHFREGWDISPWWIYAVVGALVLWTIVDLFRTVLPKAVVRFGFEAHPVARAAVLVTVVLVLFGYYAIPALEESDPVSLFMGRTSLLLVPVVLIATWRRCVMGISSPPVATASV
ncbi:hypothetical protein GIS00_11845 [Nakamurella sp. YIM 132087]|uniref:M50 family peptidase n=1 Tax=Nakamurella alba TaxID=2665158 RepID=A0A7K1FKG6_9ACTN|nr:hypothetical protein [Nakamurella alba]MTD14635.1 hypothetical protein [Nakamurella alba]